MTEHDELTELARLEKIRDNPGSRVRLMGACRADAGRQHIPLADVELTWLEDQARTDLIPTMRPQEYWALILALHADLRAAKGA